jgi:hypothetical protein
MGLIVLGLSVARSYGGSVPTIDGMFNKSDKWGSPVETLNLSNPGGDLNINAYWATDSSNVYGAFVADTSSAGWASKPGDFANIYVYSGSGVGGTVGDGNDVVIQTNEDWINADSNLTNSYPGTSRYFFSTTPDTGTTSTYTTNGVTVGWVGGDTNVIEFSIAKSILDKYPSYKLGVQGWSYDIDPSKWAYQPSSAVASTPLPRSVASGGALLALIGFGQWLRGRNSKKIVAIA